MADIEVVIKIPEELYKAYKGSPPMLGDKGMDMIAQSIANGTPLPKGYGKLIDIGKRNRKLFYQQCGGANSLITVKTAFDMFLSLPTIIEADRRIIMEKISIDRTEAKRFLTRMKAIHAIRETYNDDNIVRNIKEKAIKDICKEICNGLDAIDESYDFCHNLYFEDKVRNERQGTIIEADTTESEETR